MKKQLTLGELISKLESFLPKLKPEAGIRFAFGGLVPQGWSCYRGFYDNLCLSFTDDKYVKVTDFIKDCKEQYKEQYSGWKGGDYMFYENTPIWVASHYGNCSNCALVDVIFHGEYTLLLETEYQD